MRQIEAWISTSSFPYTVFLVHKIVADSQEKITLAYFWSALKESVMRYGYRLNSLMGRHPLGRSSKRAEEFPTTRVLCSIRRCGYRYALIFNHSPEKSHGVYSFFVICWCIHYFPCNDLSVSQLTDYCFFWLLWKITTFANRAHICSRFRNPKNKTRGQYPVFTAEIFPQLSGPRIVQDLRGTFFFCCRINVNCIQTNTKNLFLFFQRLLFSHSLFCRSAYHLWLVKGIALGIVFFFSFLSFRKSTYNPLD